MRYARGSQNQDLHGRLGAIAAPKAHKNTLRIQQLYTAKISQPLSHVDQAYGPLIF